MRESPPAGGLSVVARRLNVRRSGQSKHVRGKLPTVVSTCNVPVTQVKPPECRFRVILAFEASTLMAKKRSCGRPGKKSGQPVAVHPTAQEGDSQLRILLAEDSPTNQLIALANLEQAGHTVEVVDNGRKAVQALEKEYFDLVLMDVFMPEVDGLEATQAIRQREKGSGRHIPIIAVTTTDTKEHWEKCLEAGMDGFVSKPVNLSELHRVIKSLPSRARDPQALDPRAQEHQVVEKPQFAQPVDLNWALEVVDGDSDLLRDVVEMFSEEYPEHIEASITALAQQNTPGVERAAHRLKGILGNVGGLRARDLAQRLETMGEESELVGGAVVLEELAVEIERVVTFFSKPGWEQRALGYEGGQ